MRMNLRSRLERLEAQNKRAKQSAIRVCVYKELPSDFVGERHLAEVEPLPPGTPDKRMFRRFEERPGPGPAPPIDPDDGITVYISESDERL
jgi:hypothetical protein